MNEKHPQEFEKEVEVENDVDAKAKYAICKQCEFFNEYKFCKQCGCFMPIKVLIPGVECPINKW